MLLAIIAISLFIISIVFIKFTKRRIHVYETINDEIRYGDGRFTDKEYNMLNENDKRIKILENINNIYWFTRLISGIVICTLFIVILSLHIGVDNKVQLIKIEHDGLVKRLEIIRSLLNSVVTDTTIPYPVTVSQQ